MSNEKKAYFAKYRAIHREKLRLYSMAWRKDHPERARELKRKWYLANKEKQKVASKRWRLEHKERFKTSKRRQAIRQHHAKHEVIAGRPRPLVCDVCCQTGCITFDHCHRSGNFRGWLCRSCNTALGQVKDSAELLRKLADYLDHRSTKKENRK